MTWITQAAQDPTGWGGTHHALEASIGHCR